MQTMESIDRRLSRIEDALAGDGSEGSGWSPRLARVERLAEQNAKHIAEMVKADERFRQETRENAIEADSKSEARVAAVHDRLDGDLSQAIQKTREDVATAKGWIRGGLWVALPLYTGALGVLFWFVKHALEAIEKIPKP